MTDRMYKRASQFTVLWVLIILGGLAASVGVLLVTYGPGGKPTAGTIAETIGGAAVVSILAAVCSNRWLIRRRREAMARSLEQLGWEVNIRPDGPTRTSFFAPVGHLEQWSFLKSGGTYVQWCATRRDGPARMFEHEYVTGSGKSSQVHTHTVVAWPLTDGAPIVRVLREGRVEAWTNRRAHGEDSTIGEAEFDRLWRISGDATQARTVLSPTVRALLHHAPVGESWVIGGGWLVMLCRGSLDGANARVFLDRSRGMLAALPRP